MLKLLNNYSSTNNRGCRIIQKKTLTGLFWNYSKADFKIPTKRRKRNGKTSGTTAEVGL
jgi:hypothetical protein